MTFIRPLVREDLPRVASIYGEFVEYPESELPDLIAFFSRLLFENPWSDPEIPSWVYEDPDEGVVGLHCIHPRRFTFGDRVVRIACSGPVVVHPSQRRKGLAKQLIKRYFEGPQDISAGDRAIDAVHGIWRQLGAVADTAASIGWGYTLTPVGRLTGTLTRRALGRHLPPGARVLSKLDAFAARRREPVPAFGMTEPLTNKALIDLLPRLEEQFPLRPAYDDAYLNWLFGTMELVDLGQLVRRLVRADDGRPLGAYVMYVNPHWRAYVMQVAAAGDDVGPVLDHLIHEAACRGAIEVEGRFEPHLLPHLRRRRCRLIPADWVHLRTDDPVLRSAVLSGNSLLTRLDGEWWMRPAPVRSSEAVPLSSQSAA